MNQLFSAVEETINKTTIEDFRAFINYFNDYPVTKWTIYSDYCINDKEKLHSAATFTVVPYIDDFNSLKDFVAILAPADLKKVKKINQEFCDFIKSGYLFNFGFVFGKNNDHILNGTSKEEYIADLVRMNEMLRKWIENTPSQKKYYKNIIKKVNNLIQEVNRKSFNFKLLNNIILVNILAAYISFLICKESSHLPEIIGWFSDRDSMTTSYKEIIIDLFHINFHTICNHYNIDDSSIEIAYGKAGFGENNLWYDEMLRVPDYISGALAGRNYISESIDKYDDIFEKAISDNSFLSVINLYSENNLKGARRVTFTVNKPT